MDRPVQHGLSYSTDLSVRWFHPFAAVLLIVIALISWSGPVALVAGGILFIVGLVASSRRWLWILPLTLGTALAGRNWLDGAYSDSGHAVEYSVMIVGLVTAPFAAGVLIGRLRGSGSRPHLTPE